MKRKVLCLLAVSIVAGSAPVVSQATAVKAGAEQVAVSNIEEDQALINSDLQLRKKKNNNTDKNKKKTKVSLSVNGKTGNFDMEEVLDVKTVNLSVSAGSKTTLTSSDEKVATVDANGTVTLVGAGTATITVKAEKTAKKKAATLKITLKVVNDLAESEMFGTDFSFSDAIGKEYQSGDTIGSDNLKLLEHTAFKATGGDIIHAKFFGFDVSDLQQEIAFDAVWYNQNKMNESEIRAFYEGTTLLDSMQLHKFSDSIAIASDDVTTILENKPQYLGVAYTYVTDLNAEPALKVSYLKIEYK